jgi:hypothetical protein
VPEFDAIFFQSLRNIIGNAFDLDIDLPGTDDKIVGNVGEFPKV